MSRSSRAAARRRGERGAIAVEAALVTPLILSVLLGILELSLLLRDHVAVSSAVRTGVRTASALPGAGPATCEVGPTAPPCSPTTTPAAAQAAANAIQRAGSAMPPDSIDYILIYKANDLGYPGATGATAMPSSCSGYTACVKYVWRASANAFRYDSGTWTSSTINACLNEAESVGVYLRATHPFVTGLFGASIAVADRAVMSFEPLPADICKPGTSSPHP